MERKVATFFYGSYMNLDVLREVNLIPGAVRVARLPGFDISIRPLANLSPSDRGVVYGIVAFATHQELERLYAHARDVLGGSYLPHPLVVHTLENALVPSLCYIAPDMSDAQAADDYIDRIVMPARTFGFPAWYVERLESFRRVAGQV